MGRKFHDVILCEVDAKTQNIFCFFFFFFPLKRNNSWKGGVGRRRVHHHPPPPQPTVALLRAEFRQRHLRPIGSVTNEGSKRSQWAEFYPLEELAAIQLLPSLHLFRFRKLFSSSSSFFFAPRRTLLSLCEFLCVCSPTEERVEQLGGVREKEKRKTEGQHFQFQLGSWRVMAAESSFSHSRFSYYFRWLFPQTNEKRKEKSSVICFVLVFNPHNLGVS